MDRKTVTAILLCFAIFFAWQKYYIEPRLPKQTATEQTQSAQQSAAPTAAVTSGATTTATANAHVKHPSQTEILSTETGDAVIGDSEKFFVGWKLKNYHQSLEAQAGAVDLDSATNQPGQMELAFDDPALAYLTTVQGQLKKTPTGVSWTYEDESVRMERLFALSSGSPSVDVTLNIQFKKQHPRYAFLSVAGQKLEGKDPEERDRQLVYFSNDSIERVALSKDVALKEVATNLKYVGVQNRYFVFAAVNQSQAETKGLIQPMAGGAGRASLVYPVVANSLSIPVKTYFGPKSLPLLRSVDPTLDHTVDFGWFTPIAYPLLSILRWLYQFVRNYGVAIILLTVLLKLVTYPLTYKSMKSMKQMARLQPELQKLRDKHANDKEAQNRAVLEFMRGNGYNPAAGCLPMLIQMPIFFALYRVLYSSIELYHAPFALWIHDLSARDPYYVTPVLMSVTMFLQQKLSPSTATDPMQQKMMMLMPLMFGVFMFSLPSGLTLYMLVNALVSVIQQLILNKKLNIPHGSQVAAGAR